MAVIGMIREKSTLLLIIIGGALAAFILTDLLSSRNSVFQEDMENIGSIDGENIKALEFNRRFEEELENFKTREKREDVPEFVLGQIRDQVWNQYLNDYILGSQLDQLGVVVSVEELGDMTYGDHPHEQVLQAFTNPKTGMFNKNDIINFLKNMENDETGKTKQQWLVFERAMKQERRSKKYYTMVQKGLYATTAEAKEYFQAQNKRMSFAYVVKRYADLEDSLVEITESDIKAYYNAHSERFTEKKSRNIEYSIFNVVPSSEDSAAIKSWVVETYVKLKKTADDSSFVNANSDREFDPRFYSKNDQNLRFDTSLYLKDSIGYTSKPYIDADRWKMVKISKIKFAPDSVKARHILLSFDEKNEDKIRTLVDSLKTALKAGAEFGALAKQYSVDPGSKDDNGSLGWFREGFMIPIINDSCFNADMNKVMEVESPFGIHLLEVTEKSAVVKKMQVAVVVRGIDASRETIDQAFTASNDFSLRAEGGEELGVLAKEFNVMHNQIDISENDNMIPELESSRGVIRWAYNAEMGQVSEAMEYAGSFVVVKLLEIHEDGVAPFDRVRDVAEVGAIKDKKAEIFTAEMNGFTSLEDASQNLNLTIDRVNNVVFESYSIPNLGREPNVLGRVFTMNQDDLSVPIKGENGVYIIYIEKVDEAPEQTDFAATKGQLVQNRTARVDFEVFESLKERVEIEDNRFRFY